MPKNGNDGTYFELRLIEEICRNKQLTFRFASELSRSIDLMGRSHGKAAKDKIGEGYSKKEVKNNLNWIIKHIPKIYSSNEKSKEVGAKKLDLLKKLLGEINE